LTRGFDTNNNDFFNQALINQALSFFEYPGFELEGRWVNVYVNHSCGIYIPAHIDEKAVEAFRLV
jgi:hypothetical protein